MAEPLGGEVVVEKDTVKNVTKIAKSYNQQSRSKKEKKNPWEQGHRHQKKKGLLRGKVSA